MATSTERSRRHRAKKRALQASPSVASLSAGALLAENEAREMLGEDFGGFRSAVRRYVLAVDAAEHARAVWISEGKPMRDVFANGMGGVHPFFKAMESAEAQAARFGAELGLSPASAKRVGPAGKAGRPVGAVSAADRKAAAPALKLAQ